MGERSKSQNDCAWEALFEKYHILEEIEREGCFFISADQIKEFREPRLMAKFDHQINLPQIFAEHHLAILPVSRGDYVLSHFQAYEPFSREEQEVCQVRLPLHLQSLNASNIPSEAIAINCALASGMLADFLGEEELTSTVSGRMGSGQFSFQIGNVRTGGQISVDVSGSQIEIDAAFEGLHSLALLEAKRDLSEDFLVRQLYYPFRVWSSRVTKRVRPVFLVYTNGIFHLYEYEFTNSSCYNSLRLVQQKKYAIEDTALELSDLEETARRTAVQAEPEIAFPQADSFARVINLCELLQGRSLGREEVTEEYAFNIRQTNYYTDAARYLGLVEKWHEAGRRPVYQLTELGSRIMNLSYKQRQLALCECLFRHSVFRETFFLCMELGRVPEKEQIVEIMQRSGLYKVNSMSTYVRRASTISGWMHWMLGLCR